MSAGPQSCGNCGHATPRKNFGLNACALQPSYQLYPDRTTCTFDPSKWKPQSRIQRETRIILAIVSVEGRRGSIAEFERVFGKEEADRLRESVKAAWPARRAA